MNKGDEDQDTGKGKGGRLVGVFLLGFLCVYFSPPEATPLARGSAAR